MVNQIPDTTNTLFQLATDLVNQSSRNIFLTGKAGTGKTTFLKYIREKCYKQVAVVAPTGVAAINAGGVTMHSFFQLPFSPFIPDAGGPGHNDSFTNRQGLLSRLKMTGEKKKVLQELELLIIDEISMVRSDTLDAVDAVLRHTRHRPGELFGGVQVLFIGDMFQLPPVIPDQEWQLLSGFYKSPYFFDSRVIQESAPVYIEFDKIYRQSEEKFIKLLNQVRNNELDKESQDLLNSRVLEPGYLQSREEYIVLTTHNYKADAINAEELKKQEGELMMFNADVEGEFSEKAFPADELLKLKVGAQVMFLRNDSDKNKRYYNGKIGIVSRVKEDKIYVRCKGESGEIEVSREKWENIRYSLNKNNRQLEESVLGSFTQFPLRLAWAITIHKSQGLSFEKAIIDAGDAFAPGQVYVALSRCTQLDGMILKSPIRTDRLLCDERIVNFSQSGLSDSNLAQELTKARISYQQKILLSLFDFSEAARAIKELNTHIRENTGSFNNETRPWISKILDYIKRIYDQSVKYQSQLEEELNAATIPKERLFTASRYFIGELEKINQNIQQSPAITDSRIHAKEYNESLKEIFTSLSMKQYLMGACSWPFDIEAYQAHKKNFTVPPFRVNAYAGAAKTQTNSPHPQLHMMLRKLRDQICAPRDMPVYLVAGTKTLEEIARYLPHSLMELEQISGFGKTKVAAYGQQFLDIVLDYCHQHNLPSGISAKEPKGQRKSNIAARTETKETSFRLFKEGKTISEIATERNLTPQTIETHLTYYIRTGEINIEKLINSERLSMIARALNGYEEGSITPVKELLGEAASFGEIRMVIAWLAYKNKA